MTDGELVRQALDGDGLAFGELVDRYRRMLYGYGYHLTGEFEAAHDLAQEAFIQAFLKLSQLREYEKFGGWLRRIALNVQRSQARVRKLATVALEDEASAHAPQPSETDIAVSEALGALSEPDRLALTLRYMDGYSHAEIAGFLDVAPEVVKTRLARARQRLRKEMMAMVEDAFKRYQTAWETLDAGKTEEALRMYAVLLADDVPADVRMRVHNNLGCLYHDKLGDPAKGREHLRLAAEAADVADSPERFLHWRIYARVACGDHQWQEAIAAAARVLDKAPTDFERRNLHVVMAAAKANLGQSEEALHHLTMAATPGPEPPGADTWMIRHSPDADPLDWVRACREEFFPGLAADPRFTELVGGPQ